MGATASQTPHEPRPEEPVGARAEFQGLPRVSLREVGSSSAGVAVRSLIGAATAFAIESRSRDGFAGVKRFLFPERVEQRAVGVVVGALFRRRHVRGSRSPPPRRRAVRTTLALRLPWKPSGVEQVRGACDVLDSTRVHPALGGAGWPASFFSVARGVGFRVLVPLATGPLARSPSARRSARRATRRVHATDFECSTRPAPCTGCGGRRWLRALGSGARLDEPAPRDA